MTDPLPCPLCGESLWADIEGWKHPHSDTCPLESIYLPARLVAAWNTRAAPSLAEAAHVPEVAALIAAVTDEIDARNLFLATAPDHGGANGPKWQRHAALHAAQGRTIDALRAITEEEPHD